MSRRVLLSVLAGVALAALGILGGVAVAADGDDIVLCANKAGVVRTGDCRSNEAAITMVGNTRFAALSDFVDALGLTISGLEAKQDDFAITIQRVAAKQEDAAVTIVDLAKKQDEAGLTITRLEERVGALEGEQTFFARFDANGNLIEARGLASHRLVPPVGVELTFEQPVAECVQVLDGVPTATGAEKGRDPASLFVRGERGGFSLLLIC